MLPNEKTIEGEVTQSAEVATVNAAVTPHTGALSVEALLSQAVEKGLPVETLEKLLAMRKELNAEFAKKAFDEAMAKFQGDCPTIQKTKEVKTKSGIIAYKYAPIETIVDQVRELLKDNGFSYSTRVVTEPGGVKATCIVKHYAGHVEEYEMAVPLGNKTDIMSNSQVVAAATTFAKRYAFCNAFGIMTGDEDNEINLKEKEASVDLKPHQDKLSACKNIGELQTVWLATPPEAKMKLGTFKDELKKKFI